MKFDPCLISYIKIDTSWIIDLYMKGKTIKRLEEKREKYAYDLE